MILLAKYGRDKCHTCGKPAEMINEYETGGCWKGETETLTWVPLCREHSWGTRPQGVKGSLMGGSGGGGKPEEQAAGIKRCLDIKFGAEIEVKAKQLVLL